MSSNVRRSAGIGCKRSGSTASGGRSAGMFDSSRSCAMSALGCIHPSCPGLGVHRASGPKHAIITWLAGAVGCPLSSARSGPSVSPFQPVRCIRIGTHCGPTVCCSYNRRHGTAGTCFGLRRRSCPRVFGQGETAYLGEMIGWAAGGFCAGF